MSPDRLDLLELLETAPEPTMDVATERVLDLARTRARRRTLRRYAVGTGLVAAATAGVLALAATFPRHTALPGHPTPSVGFTVMLGDGSRSVANGVGIVQAPVTVTYDPGSSMPLRARSATTVVAMDPAQASGWAILEDAHVAVAYAHGAKAISVIDRASHGATIATTSVAGTDLKITAFWYASTAEVDTVAGIRWFDGTTVYNAEKVPLPTIAAPEKPGSVYFLDRDGKAFGQFDASGAVWSHLDDSTLYPVIGSGEGNDVLSVRTAAVLPVGAHGVTPVASPGAHFDPVRLVDWPGANGVLAVVTGTAPGSGPLVTRLRWVDSAGQTHLT